MIHANTMPLLHLCHNPEWLSCHHTTKMFKIFNRSLLHRQLILVSCVDNSFPPTCSVHAPDGKPNFTSWYIYCKKIRDVTVWNSLSQLLVLLKPFCVQTYAKTWQLAWQHWCISCSLSCPYLYYSKGVKEPWQCCNLQHRWHGSRSVILNMGLTHGVPRVELVPSNLFWL